MHRSYFLIIVAAALFCLLLIFVSLWWEIKSPIAEISTLPPVYAPYKTSISGVGIIEPESGNIMISTPLNRIVKKIYVTVGQKVNKGELLIALKNGDLAAELKVQQAAYSSAQAKLMKLQAYPRPEDLSAAEAAFKSAKNGMDSAKIQYEMVLDLPNPNTISQQEKNRRLLTSQQTEADFQRAKADLEKVKGGTWKPDLEIARHEVDQAKANVDRIQNEIAQTFIRSPLDGTILQMKIHEGELSTSDNSAPLMILGNTDEKYVRVNINQLDIPLFDPNAPATAFLRGDSHEAFPLEFVRMEPQLVNKKNLTNEISETVDTRVLQIVYLLKKEDPKLFVGQQMDVYIKTGLTNKE